MTLSIRRTKMDHEALAIRFERIVIGIGNGRSAEQLLSGAPTAKTEGVFNGMAGFMSQNPHAPFRIPALDLEHLIQFEFRQTGMGKVEWNCNARHVIRCKPF